jgi:hypothetical protein
MVVKAAAIVEDTVLQQPVAGPQRVQHHHIVGGFSNRMMKGYIEPAFRMKVADFVGSLHLFDNLLQAGNIGWSRPDGGLGGCLSFNSSAEFEIVTDRRRVAGNQLHHGFGEDWTDKVANKSAAPAPRLNEIAFLKGLESISQNRAGHFHLVGQIPFRGQPVSRLQHAFQDQIFNLLDCGIGRFLVIDGLKHVVHFLSLRGKIVSKSKLVNFFVQFYVACLPRLRTFVAIVNSTFV